MLPTVVAAPGAFVTDAEFWYRPLAELLAPHGIALRAVDLPSCGNRGRLGGLHEDAACVAKVMDEIPGPVILAGHSYSGMVISEASAGRADKVVHLLYISGITGDRCIMESDYVVPGEAPETQIEIKVAGVRLPLPKQVVSSTKTGARGRSERMMLATCRRLVEFKAVDASVGEGEGSAAFKSNELRGLKDPALIEEGLKRVTRQSLASFVQAPSALGLREIPSTFFLGLHDGEVPREQLLVQASRCTNLLEVPTNHFCHLDRPDLVADAIVAISKGEPIGQRRLERPVAVG